MIRDRCFKLAAWRPFVPAVSVARPCIRHPSLHSSFLIQGVHTPCWNTTSGGEEVRTHSPNPVATQCASTAGIPQGLK
jgi:hypothetical protein